MCEIVDIGYKASEECYVYDCIPRYNPALQGLFLCRDKDLRKSKFRVGDVVVGGWGEGKGKGKGKGVRKVLDVKYWSGRFCYRIGDGEGKDIVRGIGKDDLLLEEDDFVEMVEGRNRENERP